MTGRIRGGHAYSQGKDWTKYGGNQTNTTGYRLRHAVRRADFPAVSETRRLLRGHLRQWGVPALADTAELLATEILTNALQHTSGAEPRAWTRPAGPSPPMNTAPPAGD